MIRPEAIATGTIFVGLDDIEAGGDLLSPRRVSAGDIGSAKFRFGPQHVLYGKLRPYLAKITCPEFIGVCSTDIVPILPGPTLDRRYLLHYLRQPSMVRTAASRAVGISLPRLSPDAIRRIEIRLPPMMDQRRIAAVLDCADSLRVKRRESMLQ